MSRNSGYEKKFYNAKLDEILSKYITSKQYGDFVPVLKDIFQRRAYEYEFSDEHIESEVKNFVKKAKKIEFADESEFESKTTMGVYIPGKKIQINETNFSFKMRDYNDIDFGEMLYETLTHEVYHAISDKFNPGLETYDYIKREWNGVALNEVITEVSADRASISRTRRDFEQGRSKTDGYTDITFVANLISASLGVTEKEFLRAGIQNRKELMKLFNSKFPSNAIAKTAKKEYFDKIEASLDIIYNLNYKEKDKDEPVEIKSQLRKSALTTLYKSAYELAVFQISNDRTKSRAELADEASFRFLKLENILVDSGKHFEDKRYISRNDAKSMYDDVYSSRQKLCGKVLSLTGKTSYKQLSQYSIYNNSYGRYIMHEDFDDGRQWDNNDMAMRFVRIFEKTSDINYSEPIPINDERITEPVDIVDDIYSRVTEPVDVVADIHSRTTNPLGGARDRASRDTEPMAAVIESKDEDTEILSVVDNLKQSTKNAIDKFKQTLDIIITRFKNRKLSKLSEPREDNSEYYAGLVTNNVSRIEPKLDKYKVNVNSVHLENINVDKNESQIRKEENEGR